MAPDRLPVCSFLRLSPVAVVGISAREGGGVFSLIDTTLLNHWVFEIVRLDDQDSLNPLRTSPFRAESFICLHDLASLALLMFLIWFPLRPDVLALLPNASTSRRNRYVACSQRIQSTFFQQHITFWHVFYGRAAFWTCLVALHRKGPSLSFSRPKVFSPPSLGLSPFGLLFSRRVAFAAHCFWDVSLIALHPGGCRSVVCGKTPFWSSLLALPLFGLSLSVFAFPITLTNQRSLTW